jgi:hypothetical protein
MVRIADRSSPRHTTSRRSTWCFPVGLDQRLARDGAGSRPERWRTPGGRVDDPYAESFETNLPIDILRRPNS